MELLWWPQTATKAGLLASGADWAAERDPLVLLAWLRMRTNTCRTKDGRRKLRLFACACARRHWHRLDEHPWANAAVLREGVERAEQFADGRLARDAFEDAVDRARREGSGWNLGASSVAFMAGHATLSVAFEAAWEVARLGP